MAEIQNTPEPPPKLPNAPAKRNEEWNKKPEPATKAPEKTEKPRATLKEVNWEVQKIYTAYSQERVRLDKAEKKETSVPGLQEDANLKAAKERDDANGRAARERIAEPFKKIEKIYQDTVVFDISLVKNDKSIPPEKKKEIEWKWLAKSVTDLHYDTEPLDESRVQFLAMTFPQAWKETLLDPKSIEKNSELQKVRETILSKIPMYTEVDAKNFSQIQEKIKSETGITLLDIEEAKKFLQQIKGNYENIEWKTGIKWPTPDDYKNKEEYQKATQEYASSNPNSSYSPSEYTPMTPSKDFNSSTESGWEIVESGTDFRTWIENETTKMPEKWKGIAKEFLSKLWGETLKTGTPVLLASGSSNRALFIQNGQWEEFPVIFWSGGLWNWKWQTPVESIAKFHSVKIANGESPTGDASLTGSNTVKWASLLSSLGESQWGKWWHGVNPSRLNGGHTAGCIW